MEYAGFYTILDPFKSDNTSGGPQTYKNIIKYVESFGINVKVVTPGDEFINPNEFKFNIYQDLFNDPVGSKWFTPEEYKVLGDSSKRFAVSECGYTACTTSPYADTTFDGTFVQKISRPIFEKSHKIITASPLHSRTISKLMGDLSGDFYAYLAEVDFENFKNTNQERTISVLTVGAMNHWKGTDLCCEKYGEDLVVAGYGDHNVLKNNSKFMGKVKHEDMPQLFNISKTYTHLPRWKEPFSISTAEAFLCGCLVDVNENVGAMSFGKDLSNTEVYVESANDFKQMIKENFIDY